MSTGVGGIATALKVTGLIVGTRNAGASRLRTWNDSRNRGHAGGERPVGYAALACDYRVPRSSRPVSLRLDEGVSYV